MTTMTTNQILAIKCAILLTLLGIVIYCSVSLYKLKKPSVEEDDKQNEYESKKNKYIAGIVLSIAFFVFFSFFFFVVE